MQPHAEEGRRERGDAAVGDTRVVHIAGVTGPDARQDGGQGAQRPGRHRELHSSGEGVQCPERVAGCRGPDVPGGARCGAPGRDNRPGFVPTGAVTPRVEGVPHAREHTTAPGRLRRPHLTVLRQAAVCADVSAGGVQDRECRRSPARDGIGRATAVCARAVGWLAGWLAGRPGEAIGVWCTSRCKATARGASLRRTGRPICGGTSTLHRPCSTPRPSCGDTGHGSVTTPCSGNCAFWGLPRRRRGGAG